MIIPIYGSLFDSPHIIYIFVSLILTVIFLWPAVKLFNTQKQKDMYLKFWAISTFFLHISTLWFEFLNGNPPIAADNILFPIYFCNLSMYLLIVVSLWGDKTTKTFKYLATMAAYAGVFGSLISLFYPEYYIIGGSIFEWKIFKSMISHSTMLIGSLYLFIGGYFKINKFNTLVYTIGLLIYGGIGVIVNFIFNFFGLYQPNAMYLQHPPIADVPFLNVYVISMMMIVVVLCVSSSVEFIGNKYCQKSLVLSEQISTEK